MTIAKKQNLYTVGHIPFSVGLDGVIAEGMNEIAHIEELIWEFVDFDRNKQYSYGKLYPFCYSEPYYIKNDTLRIRKRWELSGLEFIVPGIEDH